LRQLVESGFVGGASEVVKILDRLKEYSNGKIDDPTMRIDEFRDWFKGEEHLKNVDRYRKERRNKVAGRKARGK